MKKDLSIPTDVGLIHVEIYESEEKRLPLLLLHGAYLNSSLWHPLLSSLENRTLILPNLPHHGHSQKVKGDWTLHECSQMLIEILNHLNIKRVLAVGHDLGAMILLRSAVSHPQRFGALGFANMPWRPVHSSARIFDALNFPALHLSRFHARQTAKQLFAPESLSRDSRLSIRLAASLSQISPQRIHYLNQQVLLHSESGEPYLKRLQVPAFALRGEQDSVKDPPHLITTLVPGGHISVWEQESLFRSWMETTILAIPQSS
ncbi:MAG: alpha/beta fold hydrolase [Spirochaetales bacterium]|nr:alpha/beta fold hydrolase [Spirochaetales bacterium]